MLRLIVAVESDDEIVLWLAKSEDVCRLYIFEARHEDAVKSQWVCCCAINVQA